MNKLAKPHSLWTKRQGKHAMASFASRPQRAAWSVEECALFAARKEFELLRLLSTDRKALATARRLGFSFSVKQPQPQFSASAGGGGASASRSSNADAASMPVGPSSKKKKSAAHEARGATLASRRARQTKVEPLCHRCALHGEAAAACSRADPAAGPCRHRYAQRRGWRWLASRALVARGEGGSRAEAAGAP